MFQVGQRVMHKGHIGTIKDLFWSEDHESTLAYVVFAEPIDRSVDEGKEHRVMSTSTYLTQLTPVLLN